MKMSFSLSSLQPSSLERVEHTGIRVEKPYNSLIKKRKESVQEQSVKNCSGLEDSKDDFWAAIRTNYDYIMDTNLIDTCKEANGELAWDESDVSTVSWGLKEVSCQFSELYSWLRVLQELVYSKEENLLDKSLRVAHTEELRRKAYRRRLFNEQSEKLIARAPALKEEVSWRVDHLNAKWNLVEQIMAPIERTDELDNHDVSADFEHEVKYLRKWLREMEARLQPLNFRVDWNKTEIEEKAVEHMVLQKDIEAHGRIVSSVVKLGERVAGRNKCAEGRQWEYDEEGQCERQYQQQQTLRVASVLEHRWHLLFLRALEWQCHIEALAARVRSKLTVNRCNNNSDDEEPVTKQPRLSHRAPSSTIFSASSSSAATSRENDNSSFVRRRFMVWTKRQLQAKLNHQITSKVLCHTSENNSSIDTGGSIVAVDASSRSEISSDSDISSENKFVDDGSYFEDDLDELCVMNIRTEDFSRKFMFYPAKGQLLNTLGDQGTEADIEEAGLSDEEVNSTKEISQITMTPTPDPLQTATASIDEIDTGLRPANITNINSTPNNSPKRRRTDVDEAALFNTSNRKSKNCATFYFKHMDTDSEADSNRSNDDASDEYHYHYLRHQQPRTVDESSEDEWTYTSMRLDLNHQQQQKKRKKNAVKLRLDFDAITETVSLMKNDINMDNDDRLNGNIVNAFDNDAEIKEKVIENKQQKSIDNNSDEEYVNSKDSIQKLIREVEKLVREEGKSTRKVPPLIFDEETGHVNLQNHRAKYARIKEWLALNSALCREGRCTSQYCLLTTSEMMDSCDASGEYTTGESDIEKQSETSEEDLQSSVVTCQRLDDLTSVSHATSTEILLEDQEEPTAELSSVVQKNLPVELSTPKVVLRSKRQSGSDPRPWSVSCITQIRKRANFDSESGDPISQFSISETALHQLVNKPSVESTSLKATESRAPFNNSTSTLMEETIIDQDACMVRNSSLRRRKNRLRKKNLCRKSESGSDNINAGNQRLEASDEVTSGNNALRLVRKSIGGRQTRLSGTNTTMTTMLTTTMTTTMTLMKSDSFSGCSVQREASGRTIKSDPPPIYIKQLTSYTSSASSESEEHKELFECIRSTRSSHSYSNCNDSILIGKHVLTGQFNAADSDIEKNSLGNNSFSEQAWDNYQEKYMSEPYSEVIDLETARHLLEFGDDYRNFFDSQSDCASSLSAVHYKSNVTSEDSDNDSEFKRLAETSRNQLLLSETRYGTTADNSFNELACICRENIKCLRALFEKSSISHPSEKYSKQIRGLTERWESLSLRIEAAQKINSIHHEIAAMKLELGMVQKRLTSFKISLEESHVIERYINEIQIELANLRNRKAAMLALNVSTHHLTTDLGQKTLSTSVALKDGVADLYRLWDEIFQMGNQQLCALQAINQFSLNFAELQYALQKDKDTLAVLDAALKAGATVEVASSVRDVARLLSEKHEQNDIFEAMTSVVTPNVDNSSNMTQLMFNDSATTVCSLVGLEGGSLSDSGISDSGSEQELSERERRLAGLRRLTRSLELQLMSDASDKVLNELWRRVKEAEDELRILQKQCRELIVKTATSVESRANILPVSSTNYSIHSKHKKMSYLEAPISLALARLTKVSDKMKAVDLDDPENDFAVSQSWVWRILRAALPFQLALVVLLCVACLLEPRCCEGTNSLNLSLTPQLRYIHGPPPV